MIRKIVVQGRVQGVFYRDTCKKEADRLGIAGSVRNLPDGTVEIVARGSEEQLRQLIAWCREGPRLAHVQGVAVEDIEEKTADATIATDGFRITG